MASGFDNDVLYAHNFDFSGNASVSARMTDDGQMLFGKTGGNPTVALPAVSGGITYTPTSGGGTWGFDAGSIGTGVVPVAHGGTGDSSIAAYQVVCGGTTGTDPLQVVSGTGSAGQVLTSAGAGALPTWANAAFLSWQEISGDTGAVVNTGYYVNGVGLVTVTLPVTAAQFTFIRLVGNSLANSWKLAQNGGQQVHFLSSSTTAGAGGYLASSGAYQVVTIMCTVANTEWVVSEAAGSLTVV